MYKHRRLIVSLIAAFLALLMVGGIVFSALGATSSEIKKKIDELKQQAVEIANEKAALQKEIDANAGEVKSLIEQKSELEQQIKLTRDAIDNQNAQIQEYNLMIADKQNELEDALAHRDELTEKYKARIRAMEMNGKLTYWSILFKASSFSDLLQRVEMINEIAQADQRMIQELSDVAEEILAAREDLNADKAALEEIKVQLSADEEALREKQDEADAVMEQLLADRAEMDAAMDDFDEQAYDLIVDIANEQLAYDKAKQAEAAWAAAHSSTGNSGGSTGGYTGGGASSAGFIWPVASRYITCYQGPRTDPITGAYQNHSGIDIGASYGSQIWACAGGTVTTATYSSIFGYYVVINHGNGFSTLYGHMTQYVVHAGQTVSQGQLIGYVGNTGHSTGPHLHLTMYLNGVIVNPLSYLP